jgi:DNA-binding Lrp family transcriptional regulator
MLSAYVLILTEVGKVAHVAQALSDLDGVQVAEDITGPYDIIAKIQAPSVDQLGRLVSPASKSWTVARRGAWSD